ncbi:uncharacterized protein LOC129231061 [Uloborus diversus]|uniref:uncharacterized protein LOC129231061 n=1 Tax=Uloborus diversus TaxID=327109 RepID=UPI002409174F|nr:uncharacterized protein LOC129231061 [Uloborus diversus]
MASEKRPADESDEEYSEFETNLIEKLRLNNALTPAEREYILDLVTNNDDDDDDEADEGKAHKGVQINMTGTSLHTQTVEVIESEEGKASCSAEKSPIERLMDKTYDDRRIYILSDNPRVEYVKEKYPHLFTTSQMRAELDRIFYPGKCEEFLQKISFYSRVIVDNTDCYIMQGEVKDVVDKAPSEEEQNYAIEVGSILLLPPTVYDEMTFLRFEIPNEQENYPYICADTKDYKDFYVKGLLFRVIVEQVKVGETYNFLEAVLLFFACFYVFDIEYPERSRKTLVMMEKLYLGLRDDDSSELCDECLAALKFISSKKA